MAIISPSAVNTTLVQDGQTNAISAAAMRTVVASLSGLLAVVKTSSYVLTPTDFGLMFEMTLSSAGSITVPLNATVPFDIGAVMGMCWSGTVQPSLIAASGVTFRPSAPMTPRAAWSEIYWRKRGTNEWVISGDYT